MTRGALLICICALANGPAGASPVVGPDVPMPPERPAILSDRAGGTVQEIPLPPVRPADLGAAAWAPTQPSVVSSDAGGECAALEASGVVVGSLETPITGPGACGIASPIRLSDIVLPNGERVAIRPPALMRCALASTLAAWVRDDVAPAAKAAGKRLAIIDDAGSYECRDRNRIAGAKLSEHAKGDAIDISALGSQKGSFFVVANHPENALAHAVRDSACKRFSTVLGPGSDSYHASHVHLDLETRLHSAPYCQWTLR